MTSLFQQIISNLKFAQLRQELAVSKRLFIINFQSKKLLSLLHTAIAFIAISAILFASNGYHTGFQTINNVSGYLPESLLQIITFLGDSTVALALMLFFARKNPATLWVVFVAAIIGMMISHGMKDYFAMLRPASVLASTEFYIIGKPVYLGSFPSGHSLTIFVFVATLMYFSSRKQTQLWLLLFGMTISLSRVLVGAHWPIDILIGSALGLISTVLAVTICQRFTIGFNLVIHLLLLTLLFAAGLSLFQHDGGYPLAADFAKLLAWFTLFVVIKDYGLNNVITKTLASTHLLHKMHKIKRNN